MKRCALFLWGLLFLAIPSQAVDMYLKVAGIPGDSQVEGNIDEIVIDSYSLGMTTVYSSTGVGKFTFQEFQFTKHTDRATTGLMLNTASGRSITDVTLSLRRPVGDKSFLFMKVTFFNAIVTSISNSANLSQGLPLENVTMTSRKVKVENYRQNADGSITTLTFSWDLATGGPF